MLIESFFLEAHKLLDWTLFTAAHGWANRPYYQVPRVCNYTYGGQGLHVENVYDPFEDTAYRTGPLYNFYIWLVDFIGQGPNKTWLKKRREMTRALQFTNANLAYRMRPQNASWSMKSRGYYLKQFSLSLHIQFILKFLPEMMTGVLQYHILPPIVENFPDLLFSAEWHLRKIDYYIANRSLGYHLMNDILEQLDPPQDIDDKIIPYEYISIPGKRIIDGYKNYIYIDELRQDLEAQIKCCADQYHEFETLARRQKFHAMAQGDPAAERLIIPDFYQYCEKFLQIDIYNKSKELIEAKRVCRDYRRNISFFDGIIQRIHKFCFTQTSPQIYGRYFTAKQLEMNALFDIDNFQQTNHPVITPDDNAKTIRQQFEQKRKQLQLMMSSSLYQQYILPNAHISSSFTKEEASLHHKLAALKRKNETQQSDSLFYLARYNIQYEQMLYDTSPQQLISSGVSKTDKNEYQQQSNLVQKILGKQDNSSIGQHENVATTNINLQSLYLPTPQQFEREMAKVQADIAEEYLRLVPVQVDDTRFLGPLFEQYSTDRINAYIYVRYPSMLPDDVRETLDSRYTQSKMEEYTSTISQRAEERRAKRLKRDTVLAPYKALDQFSNPKSPYYYGNYTYDRRRHEFEEVNRDPFRNDNDNEQFMHIKYHRPKPGSEEELLFDAETADSETRWQYNLAQANHQMVRDMLALQQIELQKAQDRDLSVPLNRRRVQWAKQSKAQNPIARVAAGQAPRTTIQPYNKRWNPSNFSPEDMRLASKIYPGVPFDQLIHVLDEHDKYNPPIVDPTTGSETQNWIGMPRTKGKLDWMAQHANAERQRIIDSEAKLHALYAQTFSAENEPNKVMERHMMSQDAHVLAGYTPTKW